MRKTKLFILTIFITIAIMLFAACGGGKIPDAGKKLSKDAALKLIDTYDLAAFDGDFALGLEVGITDATGTIKSTIDTKFKRTENFDNAYAKVTLSALMVNQLGELAENDIIKGMMEAGGTGEIWLSDDKIMFKADATHQTYINIPEEAKSSLVFNKGDLNFGKMLELVAATVIADESATAPAIVKADGAIDWDVIFSLTRLPSTAKTAFIDFVDILPIGSKGELKLSKFFNNFTDYELKYTNKTNIIEASINLDKFIEKFEAVNTAAGEESPLGESDLLLFAAIKNLNVKFVLGQKFFESIEVGIGGSDIGMSGTTISAKITFDFTSQSITFPDITGWPKFK